MSHIDTQIEEWFADRFANGVVRGLQRLGIGANGAASAREVEALPAPSGPAPPEGDEAEDEVRADTSARRGGSIADRCAAELASHAKGKRASQLAATIGAPASDVIDVLSTDARFETYGRGCWRLVNGKHPTSSPSMSKPTVDEREQHAKKVEYSEVRISLAECIAKNGPMTSPELAAELGEDAQLLREAMFEYRWFKLLNGKWHLTDDAKMFANSA